MLICDTFLLRKVKFRFEVFYITALDTVKYDKKYFYKSKFSLLTFMNIEPKRDLSYFHSVIRVCINKQSFIVEGFYFILLW